MKINKELLSKILDKEIEKVYKADKIKLEKNVSIEIIPYKVNGKKDYIDSLTLIDKLFTFFQDIDIGFQLTKRKTNDWKIKFSKYTIGHDLDVFEYYAKTPLKVSINASNKVYKALIENDYPNEVCLSNLECDDYFFHSYDTLGYE